ncbi:MAG TPA: response regulator [Aggregatilineales bacterium]|nr:response regulator [Anaerolineales bacterium]HRE48201.1 response regulator [Aggregatilineales bacterium]
MSGNTNPPTNASAADSDSSKRRVALIIEDNEDQGEIMSATLRRLDLEPIVEARGQDAIAKYNELHPVLIMLDINLPDMSGWEVLDALKESNPDAPPRPAVIVLTAFGDQKNRLAGKIRGVDEYLVKPLLPDQILNIVRKVLVDRENDTP